MNKVILGSQAELPPARKASAKIQKSENHKADILAPKSVATGDNTMLRSVLDNSNDPICLIDREGRLLTFNIVLKNIFHHTFNVELTEGMVFVDLLPESEQPFWASAFARTFQGEKLTEIRHFTPELRGQIFEFTFNPIFDGEDVASVTVFGRNITKEWKAREEIQFQANLLSQTGDVMIATDAAGIITYWNAAAERLLGIPDADAIGKHGPTVLGNEWVPSTPNKDIGTIIKEQGAWRGTCQLKAGGSEARVFSMSIFSLRQDATLTGWLYVLSEVTERERIAEKLVKSETQYRKLFEDNPLPMWILDIDTFQFLKVNRAACELYGYSEDEFLKLFAYDMRHKENRDDFFENYSKVTRGPTNDQSVIVSHVKKNGERISVQIFHHAIQYEGRDARFSFIEDVTERIKANRELERVGERYRLASESVNICIFEIDLATGAVERSSGFLKLLGFDPDTEPDTGTFEWFMNRVHPDDITRVRAHSVAHVNSLEDSELEYRVQHKDGHWVYLWDSAHIFADESGKAARVLGIHRDMTERVLMEQKLIEVNERYKLSSEAVTTVIYDLNPRTGRAHRSSELKDLLGFDPEIETETATVEWWLSRIHPDDLSLVKDIVENVNPERTSYELECRMQHKDGRWIYVWDTGHISRDESGRAIRVVGSIRDITERIQLRHQLMQANERFQLAAEAVSSLIYDLDLLTGLCDRSSGLKPLLGFDPIEEPETGTIEWWRSRIHPDDLAYANNAIADLRPEKKLYESEYRMCHKDGHWVYVWDRSILSSDAHGKPVRMVGCTQDITLRRQMEVQLEEERNRALAAKEKAEEMTQLKSNFLANMSHEIRTPMTAILGFAEILKDRISDQVLVEHAATIESSANRLLSTINNILDHAQIESKKLKLSPELIEINGAIQEICASIEPLASSKQIRFVFHRTSENSYAVMDPQRFDHIVTNLAGNAIKFTRRGEVAIRVQFGKELENPVPLPSGFATYRIGEELQQDYFRLIVEDTGQGIASENLAAIFEEFTQESTGIHRIYEGSGLGLTITSRLVLALGGSIEVRSAKGVGSSFIVCLPLHPVPPTEESLPERDAVAKLKLLLVEDSIDTVKLVQAHLEDRFDIIHASTIATARAIVKDTLPDFIFMDINLGEFTTGIELTVEFRREKRLAAVPIVAVTAYAKKSDRKEAFDAGCSDFLSKPFTRSQLFEVVNRNLPVTITEDIR